MEFNDFPTIYATNKHLIGKRSSPLDYYAAVLLYGSENGFASVLEGSSQHDDDSHIPERGVVEGMYVASGKPYYNVYPDYAPLFGNTSLKFPTDLFRSPYPVFAVRFAKGKEPVFGHMRARSFLLKYERPEDEQHLRNLWRVGLAWEKSDLVDKLPDWVTAVGNNSLGLLVDTINVDGSGPPMMSQVHIAATTECFEDCVAEVLSGGVDMPKDHDGSGDDQQLIEQLTDWCLRVGVSVAMLAQSAKYTDPSKMLIEPDILNKDFAAYLAAVNARNTKVVDELAEKASRARSKFGRPGYSVGKSATLLGRRPFRVAKRDPDAEGTGNELKYCHWRSAYCNYYWIGSGADKQRVPRWLAPKLIRGDLPPDTRPKGQRTLRSKMEEAVILKYLQEHPDAAKVPDSE